MKNIPTLPCRSHSTGLRLAIMNTGKIIDFYFWSYYFYISFRLVLRCRADARKRFAAMRSDVLVKLELLDNKHVQDIVHQVIYTN